MTDARVLIVTHVPRRPRRGNRVTALRWARHLRALGARVRVRPGDDGAPLDLLVAVHAERSAAAVRSVRARAPRAGHRGTRVVVALSGTDVYAPDGLSELALETVALADRVIALEPAAIGRLPEPLRAGARVVRQSSPGRCPGVAPDPERFDVLLAAHLRPVKDPLLAARAVALLPETSRVRVTLVGTALDPELGAAARRAEGERFRWVGACTRRETLLRLAAARLALCTSRAESAPSAVGEAIAAGVPVLATRIDGLLGLLGPGHPGWFEPGDAAGLAQLLGRAETEPAFLADLAASGERARPFVDPAAERAAWRALLAELGL